MYRITIYILDNKQDKQANRQTDKQTNRQTDKQTVYLVVMELMVHPEFLVFLALEDHQEALVDADVLLLRLHHPHPLFPHLVHDPEYVDHVELPDPL